ncbi:hypothetical protein XELAEV_18008087mg [Xenopus laevis]|uniref:Reverse transcriptase domain-containing protein n=1 Tax=Xenopus laevis TaxID=8355 RepID=A0A974E2K4_XENLA|nr:hypothetical protein XELAEV_18008087mg [Xenopus laevis]
MLCTQYANLFMAKLEEDFLSTSNTKPLTYLLYIDDIFIIWTDTEQELIPFHKQFQDFHPTINLKMSYSPTHIHSGNNHSHQGKYYSNHHIALQYNCICSDTAERNLHLKTLKVDINRGFNPMIEDQYIHAATRIPRSQLPQYKQKPEINRVPLVVTYNPQLRTLRKIACQPKVTNNKKCLIAPHQKWNIPLCQKIMQNLPHILTSDKIPILDTLEEYSIHNHYNCSSSNVVYLIQCTKCITGGLYIGETGLSL